MKKLFVLLACVGYCGLALAQEAKDSTGYQFTTVKELKITPIKDQFRSGTCWSFSTLAMVEAELLRMGKGEYNLSEMFVVYNNYVEKAVKYVRLQGKGNFAAGGSAEDVMHAIREYGIVPQEAMQGLNYGEEQHVHGELDMLTSAYVNALIKNPNRKLSTAWKNGFKGILDAYLGEIPANFTYNEKSYTPKSFAASLGFNPDDYVSLTSYTHHLFYTQFAIEIEDNWRWDLSYNIPLDELMQTFDNAINNGYTIAWSSDVSEKGFTRNGIAVVPDINFTELSNSEQARWLGLSQKERDDQLYKLDNPGHEKNITQEMRQIAYDNYETTDDHGMLIYGIAKDQRGTKYYMVKNSWGESGTYKGHWYASEAFVKYKTMSILVHKNALPAAIKQKLNIK
ncbi:MAG: aminopeptidase [Prevotellaceae bacterium]|jgi:aminopeptidase C|nr:aminopeptidase [Prevotellaceae bacterium]